MHSDSAMYSLLRFSLCDCLYHLIRLVDQRISLNGLQEQVLIVVLSLADGISVGGEVADSVNQAVAILAHIGQIGGILASIQTLRLPCNEPAVS